MARTLKHPADPATTTSRAPADVPGKVAAIIDDIRTRGDAAVKEYSAQFDGWEPESFRLSPEQVRDIVARVPQQVLDDIDFVQRQVRGFAERQLESLQEFEVETLPGVHLGQKHVPIAAAGMTDRKSVV